MPILEDAFRAGVEEAALKCDESAAGYLRMASEFTAKNEYVAMQASFTAAAIQRIAARARAIPTPPEYAAPARVWVRAEEWRGEPHGTAHLWWYAPSRGAWVSMECLGVDCDGMLIVVRPKLGPVYVTPVLTGDVPDPPKEAGK
jgi:hypothetical protein